MLLENDPSNPCVGCGPAHPFGLRLVFEGDEVEVSTTLAARGEWQGAPGKLHSAILYLAMTETANWTVYGLLGRIGAPRRTSALAARRFVAVGETLRLVGRRAAGGAEPFVASVEARDARGDVVATLERAFDLPTEEEFRRRFGYDETPAGYVGAFG
jgi:hypothetical protein